MPHIISPGEFNLESPASAIVSNATNLNIFHTLTLHRQRIDAVDTITHPIPTAGAPVEIRIEIDIHLGSIAMQASATMLGSVLIQLLASLYEKLSGDLHSVVKEFKFGVRH